MKFSWEWLTGRKSEITTIPPISVQRGGITLVGPPGPPGQVGPVGPQGPAGAPGPLAAALVNLRMIRGPETLHASMPSNHRLKWYRDKLNEQGWGIPTWATPWMDLATPVPLDWDTITMPHDYIVIKLDQAGMNVSVNEKYLAIESLLTILKDTKPEEQS